MNETERDNLRDEALLAAGVLPDNNDPIEQLITAAIYNPDNETPMAIMMEISDSANVLNKAAMIIVKNHV